MDLRKGCKVEVFSRREVPAGSWRCAEIVSGDGHTHHVKYGCRLSDVRSAVERVPRKVIRPRPPPMEYSRAWAPGDIVDVFIDSSWVLSEVDEVLGNDFYVLRIVGCSKKLQVHALDIRARLSWQDNKWVIIGKDCGKCYHGRMNSSSKDGTPALGMSALRLTTEHDAGERLLPAEICSSEVDSSWVLTSSTRKRRRIFFSAVDASTRKARAIEKAGRPQRLVAGHSFKLMEKVDAVVSPQNLFGEKYVNTLNKTIAHCEMDLGRFNRSTAGECCLARPLDNDNDDAERTSSSSVVVVSTLAHA